MGGITSSAMTNNEMFGDEDWTDFLFLFGTADLVLLFKDEFGELDEVDGKRTTRSKTSQQRRAGELKGELARMYAQVYQPGRTATVSMGPGTVVRTPYRRSSTDPAATAEELELYDDWAVLHTIIHDA